MVTANRKKLAQRAIQCFLKQTYPNKELVIIDDGEEDYSILLTDIPKRDVTYLKLEKNADAVLGKLRNIALETAKGDFLIQWDDDDWYHPDRIQIQADYLQQGYDACCLSSSLMHLDDPEYLNLPFIGKLPDGIPGSIMHRRNDQIRYPEYKKAEDTVYLKDWMKLGYGKLPEEYAYLFIRCYHGTNTWEKSHFKRRIKNSFPKWLAFNWYKYVVRNLSAHPKFKLDDVTSDAFKDYIKASKELGLID